MVAELVNTLLDIKSVGSAQLGIASHTTSSISILYAGEPVCLNAKTWFVPGAVPKIAVNESYAVIEVVVKIPYWFIL